MVLESHSGVRETSRYVLIKLYAFLDVTLMTLTVLTSVSAWNGARRCCDSLAAEAS